MIDHGLAFVASLPATIRSKLKYLIQSLIGWTVVVLVPGLLAHGAGNFITRWTGGDVVYDVLRSDEHRAICFGAVSPVACVCVEFLFLLLEGSGEFFTDPCFDTLARHVAFAAFWRIQRLVFHRSTVDLLEAGGTVMVTARRLPYLFDREAVIVRRTLDVRGSASSRDCTGFGELGFLLLESTNGAVLQQFFGQGLANRNAFYGCRVVVFVLLYDGRHVPNL
jgi:hypothetical protein